jgi:hypothetical protein
MPPVSVFVSLDRQGSLYDCHGILLVLPHIFPIGSLMDMSHKILRDDDIGEEVR